MTASLLASQLKETAGISPSWHFLESCCSALGEGNAATVADRVFEQILHHDLRDVVRVLEPSRQGSADSNADSSLASVQLRHAIRSSQNGAHNNKATLPESFRLLVQVEELLDVSMNAEARYAGNSTTGAPANRCLKLLLSDGYYQDGQPVEAASEQENRPLQQTRDLIIAMEVTTIPKLAVQSPAGIKALLKGPIIVRHGVLQLHAGNLVVIGGQVQELVAIQKQTMQQARRLAGVDPTIRALIGPEGLIDVQDENDEGEGESGDIPPQGARPVAQPVHAPPSQMQQPQMHPVHNGASSSHNNNGGYPSGVSVNNSDAFIQANNSYAATLNNSSTGVGNRSGASFTGSGLQAQSSGRPTNQSLSSATNGSAGNPYSAAASASTASGRNPYGASHHTHVSNLVAQGATGLTQPNPYTRPVMDVSSSNNTRSLSPLPTSPVPALPTYSSTSNSSGPSNSGSDMQVVVSSPQSMSLDNLCHLLLQCRTDQELYRRHVGKLYTTAFQQEGLKLYFNAEKRKKSGGSLMEKKGDKYEYAMWSKFKSPGSVSLVTCKIASSILEPFFGAKPGDVRKMNREDKQRANDIVREGGRKVQELLNGLHHYEWTLEQSPEEYFTTSPSPDGSTPVVLLLRVRNDV